MPKKREIQIINGVDHLQCSKCGKWFPSTIKYFRMHSNANYLLSWCRTCEKIYNKEYCKKWSKNNKQRKAESDKVYYKQNSTRIKKITKKYRELNPDKKIQWDREWRKRNRKKINKKNREWYKNNIKLAKESREGRVPFLTYARQLTIEENPKKGKYGKLVVKCAYCGKYFYPTQTMVCARINSLVGRSRGENRLYCSQGCKDACPIFHQINWPKGFKPATSREVDPLIRQMCLKRDDYTCQRCGKYIDEVELHSHHIEGAVQQPMLANDVDNTITLCKPCHILVHKQSGCTYYDLRCKK